MPEWENVAPAGAPPADQAPPENPRWLVILGLVILVILILTVALALGIYAGERDLFNGPTPTPPYLSDVLHTRRA